MFKIGDIVRAKDLGKRKGNHYGITNSDGLYRISHFVSSEIVVEIIMHKKSHHIGEKFSVDPSQFELDLPEQDEDNQI